MTGEMVIEARGLTKRFGRTVALDDVDLNIPRGGAFALLGPAGSGKSTIVRLLAGLTRPGAGTLVVEGAPAGTLEARRHLGVLLQDAPLYGWMTGREALVFAADLGGVARSEIKGRVDEVAQRLGLEDVLGKRVATLAPPVRGRLAIAEALAGNAGILLLDEPFQWLDPEGRAEVLAVLRDLRGSKTIVLATSRSADVDALCDRVAVLEAGRVVSTSKVVPPAPQPREVPVTAVAAADVPARALRAELANRMLDLIRRELRR